MIVPQLLGGTASGGNATLAPLQFPDQNHDSERSTAGLRASYDWKVGSAVVKPEVRGQWQHEFGTESSPVDARFASGAGGVFTVHAPEVDRDSALVSAGLSVQWNKRVSTYVYYDGQLLRGNYDSHNVSGGLSVSF